MVRLWSNPEHQQCIGQIELLAWALARLVWNKRLAGRYAHWFLDNESARHCAISGSSPVPASRTILRLVADACNHICSLDWVSRVPSASNPADAPSRMDFKELEASPAMSRTSVDLRRALGGLLSSGGAELAGGGGVKAR